MSGRALLSWLAGQFPPRAVAQLVEHRSPKPKVGGSIPFCPAPFPTLDMPRHDHRRDVDSPMQPKVPPWP